MSAAFVRITIFIDCDLERLIAVKHLPDGSLTITILDCEHIRVHKPDEVKRLLDYVESNQYRESQTVAVNCTQWFNKAQFR